VQLHTQSGLPEIIKGEFVEVGCPFLIADDFEVFGDDE
jgi:hypothetical protein